MKNVLVLGGTRFFGRKLVELLIADGHHVTIITRGQSGNPFGNKVEHLAVDRKNKQQFAEKVKNRTFDLVFDNICFSPNEAYDFCEVFNGKINKLVFTSTLSTYTMDGREKHEADFDPYSYEITMGNSTDFSYGEGKRQAEAVFFKYAKFPVVAVRFPIVMGSDDYTRRLHFHIERVMNGEPIGFVNMGSEMSYIHAEEAARFLQWAGETDIEGPFNATANGKISLNELIKIIEAHTGNKANVVSNGEEDTLSPYAISESWYMSNKKAVDKGFSFTDLEDWLPPLVEAIINEMK
ncbi:NAD dependent epimerase/dehydratase [Robertmurraya siralis]|uniref:NAD dependent epimerase/dehydratase n=1 Tax=Robertmurraya siralis TaxID=77777 RepID=A0A920BTE5_9BACI|nr:NAD-dependent epimerase/dehydratase family protein [Robertmurraya siralis]GIN61759.1 NAD dependent epimerase/dehydratase [Robertmurraya siralis]